jgi:hypothetical protein
MTDWELLTRIRSVVWNTDDFRGHSAETAVQSIKHVLIEAAPQPDISPAHVCGLQGFGSRDVCRACALGAQ